MLIQTIISLTVIIVLTLVMSFLLVKVVKQVNRESKDYFEKKIVVYDDLINEKQKQLDNIESEISSVKDATKVDDKKVDEEKEEMVVLNEEIPNYKISGFFEQAKIVDDKFKIDKEKVIKEFVSDKVSRRDGSELSESLKALYEKLNFDNRYNYLTDEGRDGWSYVIGLMDGNALSVMKQYISGAPKADINEILSYIKLEMDKASSDVVVETGDKGDNFAYIYNRIKTIYNPNIYSGLRIFYQDRMYDYSLGSEM